MFYIPFIVIIAGYFSLKIVLSSILTIWFLGILTQKGISSLFIKSSNAVSYTNLEFVIWLYSSVFITGIITYSLFFLKTKKSKKAINELKDMKNSALNLEPSTESSFFDEDRFSHLVKYIIEAREELNDMLNFTKKVINAESATLFILEGDNLVLRASTVESSSEPTYAEKSYLLGLIKEKKPIVRPKLKGSFFGLGYRSTKNIGSFLCVPVLDGDIALGALVIASNMENAFGDSEKDITGEFALQIRQILKRMRMFVEIERFTKGFKTQQEASSKFSRSLEVEKIAAVFVELVSRMVSSSAAGFFIADKGKLRVIAKKGFEPDKESFYTKNTFFKLIIKNKQLLHFSRLDKKPAVYPFKVNDTKTFLGIPIIPEQDVLGIIAVTSKETNAISSFQVHIIQTIADQAAMCISNALLHKQVENLAITDGLTGLYNHKHFQERLNDEFKRIKRIPQTLSLMLIDIDHFKKINDIHGHPAGDTVLSNLSIMLKKTLRGIDFLARYGGEEFVAVLMGTGSNGAKKMAERLRSAVMNNVFHIDGNNLSITLSIGVATHPNDAEDKAALIDKADQALYYAKENGRNQVCEWKNISKQMKSES